MQYGGDFSEANESPDLFQVSLPTPLSRDRLTKLLGMRKPYVS